MIGARAGYQAGRALLVTLGIFAQASGSEESRSARTVRDYSGSCLSAGCHGNYAKQNVIHAPVAAESCDACHESLPDETHKFKLTASEPGICFECHDEPAGKSVHEPVRSGRCTVCHDPHAGNAKHLLAASGTAELCAQCHDEVLEGLSFVHGPVAAGACTACHAAHASDHGGLLTAESRSLCLECHTDTAESIAEHRHVHQPVRDSCTVCHRPHGADNKLMLVSGVARMCFECHDDIEEQVDEATTKHSPMSTGRSCTGCHLAHASSQKGLLGKSSIEICLDCHDKTMTTESGEVANIAESLKENPIQHGPIADGDCTICHDAHGTKTEALLARAYPAKFYSPYSEDAYGLCFDCHDAEAFADASTEDATEFRNGSQNLHYLHVNRPAKGRSCRACHEPHASRHPKHIAERVRFGTWRIPINFTPTPTGGGCQPGCHRPYGYDRESAVANVAGG